jgi:hypothetical protein
MRRISIIAVCMTALLASIQPAGAQSSPYRAFSSDSYWNTKLGSRAPVDPNSGSMMSWLISHASPGYVTLAGAATDGSYGQPIYGAKSGDPVYAVRGSGLPPEFAHLRIPRGAKPDSSGDSELTVFDEVSRYVSWLSGAHFDGTNWSATGGSVTYLASNGLDGTLSQSNEPRNRGHRGFPAAEIAVRYDEVAAGGYLHVVKMSIPNTCNHVFPMSGDEGCSGGSPFPEGTRIRIKRTIDLSQLGLSPAALVVAQALRQYGAVVGDQSGGSVVVKVENTVAEGRGNLWLGVMTRDSLSNIPLQDFEVIKLGYGG